MIFYYYHNCVLYS